jgi:Domain of unknown function (DUF222)
MYSASAMAGCKRDPAKKFESVDSGILEYMFDKVLSAEVVERLRAAARAENHAAGQRLAVIGELDVLWLRRFGERETWCTDTQEAITAEVAAALNITQALAASYLAYARAMRLRLPRVGALLVAGDIDYRMFQTIVYRTELITDPEVLAAVDAQLAVAVPRWPALTRGRLAAQADRIVARADRDAVRRRRERQADRELSIWDSGDGLTEVFGRLLSTDAHAVDARLDALAATVCAGDPRSRNQCRADAMGALAAGADRLTCGCGRPDCPAGRTPVPTSVVIHVIAEKANLDGTATTQGSMIGADALIPAEVIAELAKSAKLVPLVHPTDAAPEAGYTPSQALADFVRCRDLTCRFPGCERPAHDCDIDHTIAHADGGPTHASNLKSLCRLHHLLKTFYTGNGGWADRQLPDGTVEWTAPSGHTYTTTPGGAIFFPTLARSTGELKIAQSEESSGSARGLMMPRRKRTRAEDRHHRITAERRINEQRLAEERRAQQRRKRTAGYEPPPF